MPTTQIARALLFVSVVTAGAAWMLLLADVTSLSMALLLGGLTLLVIAAILRSVSGARPTQSVAHILYDTERERLTSGSSR